VEDSVIEHLNNNRMDNRLENLALAHQKCNIQKVNSFDYQIIAKERLKKNESKVLLERKNIEDRTPNDTSTEIQINQANHSIVEQFITERVNTDGAVEWQDALYAAVYKCRETTGYGSTQSVREYLKTLTSMLAPFMIIKDEKTRKKMIARRTGN
jgi:hypothetical protein